MGFVVLKFRGAMGSHLHEQNLNLSGLDARHGLVTVSVSSVEHTLNSTC